MGNTEKDLIDLLKEVDKYLTFDKGSAYITKAYMEEQDDLRKKIKQKLAELGE